MSKKRVFILGAGFSKQAGMPLSTELTDLFLAGLKRDDHAEAWRWAESLCRQIRRIVGDHHKVNIEEFFHYAAFEVERCKMRQQLCRVGRRFGDTPWNDAEAIEAWLADMLYDLAKVIWARQRDACALTGQIKQFTDRVGESDIIITFNYDTLVEEALSDTNRSWNHGLNDKNGGIVVLKMHGSIDWLVCRRGETDRYSRLTLLFQKEDINRCSDGSPVAPGEGEYEYELARIERTCLADWMAQPDLQVGSWKAAGTAGLGTYKFLHQLPGSGQVWAQAHDALSRADEIAVIGFSFSPFDVMAQMLFATAVDKQHEATPEGLRVKVVNPSCDESYVSTVRRIFAGPVHFLTKKIEDCMDDVFT